MQTYSRLEVYDSNYCIYFVTSRFYFLERKISRTEDVPAISITSDDAIEKSIAVVSMAPVVFQGQVVINQVRVMEDHGTKLDNVSDITQPLPPPPPVPQHRISDCDSSNKNTTDTTVSSSKTQISEQDIKKITRNLNNGTKRKTKLRRLGSRQNSKTESDSDEDPPNVVLDAPRRIKRKTSRAKRANDSFDKPDEPVQPDDVVYVLKIKPGQMIEQTEVSFDLKAPAPPDDDELTPVESPVIEIESIDASFCTASNVFVKTKRRIYTPVENQAGAVIGKDIESSSASDRNENEIVPNEQLIENKLITNLPPLPHSPSMQRRLEQKANQSKEPSPAIRIMIAKYNQRLSAERRNSSPHSSGSCSPVAWRSPVLERRVRTQTEKYLGQVTKSSSAGNVQKDAKLSEAIAQSTTNTQEPKVGVVKSSSAGILPENWSSSETDVICGTFLACDSLKKITNTSKENLDSGNLDEKHERIFRKNTEYPFSFPLSASKSGASRKILSKPPTKEDSTRAAIIEPDADDLPDKITNTLPKIKRKYDAKPPSPKPVSRAIKASLELNIRSANLMNTHRGNSPETPLSDRAQKLKKAKEEFLKSSAQRSPCYCKGEDVWKNRLSQISGGSESSADELVITKSASVGMIHSSGMVESPAGTSSGADGYESLPRNATRTCKSQGTIGKFGLSTIASKLRNVKLRRNSKELNTVTKLCRQSLMVDISREERKMASVAAGPSSLPCTLDNPSGGVEKSQSMEKIRKSGSTQTMGLGSLLFRRQERAQKLKKSKSSCQLDGSDYNAT